VTDLLERLRKVEPDKPGVRTRWHRNPDGPEAADEIERLRGDLEIMRLQRDAAHEAIRRLAEQDATLSVRGGKVTVTMDATFTDEEREAITLAAGDSSGWHRPHSQVLLRLLDRTRTCQK
jgi:hypothetical protein